MNLLRKKNRAVRNRADAASRRGVAVTEVAIIIPLILLLTFATLEICEAIFLKQKVEIAAHEGARAAIRRQGSTNDALIAVQNYLDARNVNYGNIADVVSVSPSPESADVLTPITVTVEVEGSQNIRLPTPIYRFLFGAQIGGEVTMYKEFANQ